jgi:hypothetical protein
MKVLTIASWLSRAFLSLTFVVSVSDLIHFSTNPSAYPIPSTEIGDPRYSSAARFLGTTAVDGAVALVGLLLWAVLARRRARTGAAVSSIVVAAILIVEARVVTYLWT